MIYPSPETGTFSLVNNFPNSGLYRWTWFFVKVMSQKTFAFQEKAYCERDLPIIIGGIKTTEIEINNRIVIGWNLIGQSKNGSKSVGSTRSGRKNGGKSRSSTAATQTTATSDGLEGVNTICKRINSDICAGNGCNVESDVPYLTNLRLNDPVLNIFNAFLNSVYL